MQRKHLWLTYEGRDDRRHMMSIQSIKALIFANSYEDGVLTISHPRNENEVKFVEFMWHIFEPYSINRISKYLSNTFRSYNSQGFQSKNSDWQRLQAVVFLFRGQVVVATKLSTYESIMKQVIRINEANYKKSQQE